MQPPAQSPDLNIKENLWSTLDTNIRKRKISCKADRNKALIDEWAKITPQIIQKLVDSMPNRLKMVVDNKGGNT